MRLFSLLPLVAVHFMGAIIGWLFYLIPNKRRSTTQTNIALCFPEFSAKEKHRLLRKSLIETGKGVAETGSLWLWSRQKVLNLIKSTTGEDFLKQAMNLNKGCIIAAPHIGTWEMVGLYCSQSYPMTNLYRPPPVAGMDNLMRKSRERTGAKLVPTDRSGVKSLFAALNKGELIGILPDHNPGSGTGVFAPFFGVQANTMTLLSKLAAKTGAVVLFVYAERLSHGRGYELHFVEAAEEINNADLKISCAAVNAGVEKCIRELPEQYLWCYKRFQSRPKGEASFYKR